MEIRTFIIEDDLLSRTLLCDLLDDHFPRLRIIGMAGTVAESIKFLQSEKIDLLFLDIELPDGNGYEVLSALRRIDFEVIVTTAKLFHITEPLPFKILSTIVKPVSMQNLDKSLTMMSFLIPDSSTLH